MKQCKKRILSTITVMIILISVLTLDITGNKLSKAKASTDQNQTYSIKDENNAASDTLAAQLQTGEKVFKEENISLPKYNISSQAILGMSYNPNGICEVFIGTFNPIDNSIIECFRYSFIKGEWKASPIRWNDTFGANTKIVPYNLQYSPNGDLYCLAFDQTTTNRLMSLAKIEDDGAVKIVDTPNILSTKIDGNYPSISSYIITKNNLFIFSISPMGLYAYDLNTGKMIISKDDVMATNITSKANTISYLDYSNLLVTIDITTGKEINNVFVGDPNSDDFYKQLLLTDGNDIYTVSRKGIYRFQDNNSVCLVGEYVNQINQPSNYIMNAFISKDGSFYTLSYSDSYELNRYVLTNTANLKYHGTFTFAIYENNDRVYEAITLFAKSHPDIKIKCIPMSADDSLQTQRNYLEHADVIVYKDQVYPSLKSFDLLKDLDSTAQSLVTSQGLYKNIIDALYDNKKLYAIPVEFTPYVYAGNKSLLKNINSISSMLTYSMKSNAVWQGMDYQALGHVSYQFLYPMLKNEDGSWNKKGLETFFNSLKTISSFDNSYSWSSKDYWFGYNCYLSYLANRSSLLATEIKDTSDLINLLGILKNTGDSYQCSGAFEADTLVSINKKSDAALADDFLTILSGPKAQSVLIGDSIPIRSNSIDDWLIYQYPFPMSDYEGNIISEGNRLTDNDINCFKYMLKGISRYVRFNESQAEELAANVEIYMKGIGTVDDAIDRITKQIQ